MMIEFRGDHGTVATVDIGAPTPAGDGSGYFDDKIMIPAALLAPSAPEWSQERLVTGSQAESVVDTLTAAMAEVLAIFEIIPGSGDKPWAELRCRRCSPLWASVHTPTGPDGRELALFITAPSTLDELVQAALDHARSIDHEEN